jgi:hypothetical protein
LNGPAVDETAFCLDHIHAHGGEAGDRIVGLDRIDHRPDVPGDVCEIDFRLDIGDAEPRAISHRMGRAQPPRSGDLEGTQP